jgi:hypothetical protein
MGGSERTSRIGATATAACGPGEADTGECIAECAARAVQDQVVDVGHAVAQEILADFNGEAQRETEKQDVSESGRPFD